VTIGDDRPAFAPGLAEGADGAPGGGTVPRANAMDGFINTIEWLAAIFIGLVSLNIFVSVVLRKFFNTSIPDSYDFGRMLLGILIFWGVAVQTAMLFDKVRGTFFDHVLTSDLNIPMWPFYAIAWVGDVAAVILIAVRTWRLVLNPRALVEEHYEESEAAPGLDARP